MKTMWMSFVCLGVLLVALLSVVVPLSRRSPSESSVHPQSPSSTPHQTTSYADAEASNSLICLVTLMDAMYDIGQDAAESVDFHVCNPVVDGQIDPMSYRIELPTDIADVQKALLTSSNVQESFYLSVPDGSIDKINTVVDVPDPTLIRILDEAPPLLRFHQQQGRRKLAPSSGNITALVLWIRTTDSEPTVSRVQLYRDVFSDDVSLKWQYRKCSWGKFSVEPTTMGVLEVQVDKSTAEYDQVTIKNAAEARAVAILASNSIQVGSTTEYANMVLFITPPMGNWLAYASVGGGTSVYNDAWGSRVAALMHETGHNLGLLHANEGGEYRDHTGYMGGAVKTYDDRDDFPEKCYNAANHAQLGWYDDRKIVLNPNFPQKIRLAAFAHYDKTIQGTHYIVASTGNVFMQYNRGTGINSGTYEYKDYLVIVAQQQGRVGTELVKALNYPFDPLFEYDDGGQVWTIEICDEYFLNGPNEPDYLEVSIGYGPSLCGQSIQQTTAASCKWESEPCMTDLQCCSGNCKITPSGVQVCGSSTASTNKDSAYLPSDDRRNGGRRRFLKGSRP